MLRKVMESSLKFETFFSLYHPKFSAPNWTYPDFISPCSEQFVWEETKTLTWTHKAQAVRVWPKLSGSHSSSFSQFPESASLPPTTGHFTCCSLFYNVPSLSSSLCQILIFPLLEQWSLPWEALPELLHQVEFLC